MGVDGNTDLVRWLRENREDSYVGEVAARDRRCASIFMVPKMLKGQEGNDACNYTPQAISMGPYHFLQPHLAQMESEKSKIVALAVMSKLPPDFFSPLQMIREGGWVPELEEQNFFARTLHSGCRDYYGNAEFVQMLSQETFALMMFRDASFLLLFLAIYVIDREYRIGRHSRSDANNPFHGLQSGKGLYLDVIKDVVKLENQIPLFVLESLYAVIGDQNQTFQGFVAQICSYYSPFWIQSNKHLQDLPPLFVNKGHLLHCLHESTVNKKFVGVAPCYNKPYVDVARSDKGWSPLTWIKKHILVFKRSEKPRDHPSRLYGSGVLPSAVELSKAGVKFKHYEGGIKYIGFEWRTSTLYLPVLKIGIISETIIRNLIAFELCSSECEEHPVSSFARLLEELSESDKDVEVLRRNGIIVNWVGRDDKAAQIVKSLSRSTWKPYYEPVNNARAASKIITHEELGKSCGVSFWKPIAQNHGF